MAELTAASPRIPFIKMSGSGNDFIVIDNRQGLVDADRCKEWVRLVCRHKLSVGADGVILLENDPEVDFKWRFFNADGSEPEMCGNGARCAARVATLRQIVQKPRMAFRTLAGIIEAELIDRRVKVKMTPPHGLETDCRVEAGDRSFCLHFINTGVPHVVVFMESEAALEEAEVFGWGRLLRYHEKFKPAGTNVNFVRVRDTHRLAIRTYERGVEDETLACGTGSIAAVLTAGAQGLVVSPVEVQTRSGEILTIHFQQSGQGGAVQFEQVYLEGDAKVVYEAKLWDETLKA